MFAFGIPAIHAQGCRVNSPKIFHEERLAFHDAQAAGRGAIPVAQDSSGIAHHRHVIAPVGKFV